MTSNFLDYSKYYDLLYSDKNYQKESEFIADLIQKYNPSAKTVLNIGCGTGRHDQYLRKLGYDVTGIDASEVMIRIAKENNSESTDKYYEGNARTFRAGKTFDVVISLFHVMSYQNSNQDVLDYFETISTHLNNTGVAIIDYWYSPAVIHLKPENRTKKIESSDYRLTRLASTVVDYMRSIATVTFDLSIQDVRTGRVTKLTEHHPMRFFSLNEIDFFANSKGLTSEHYAWLSVNDRPTLETWCAYSIFGRKNV